MFVRFTRSNGPYLIKAIRIGGRPRQIHIGKPSPEILVQVSRILRALYKRSGLRFFSRLVRDAATSSA
jgi:hypothetical protein